MKTINLLGQTTMFGLIGSAILLSPLPSQALTVEEVPNPQSTGNGWVTDMADILSQDTEAELNRLITNLESTNGAEIAVVTVPETDPADSPKTFATQLFNHWGIGKAESDNGILFLISQGDRRVEIETGYGIEGILPDARVGNIIDTKITPQYKNGNFDRGTLNGTEALINSVDTFQSENSSIDRDPDPTETSIDNPDIAAATEINSPASGENGNILAILAGMGLASLAGGAVWWRKRNKILIRPGLKALSLDRTDSRQICCAKCKQSLNKIDEIELTKTQQVAKKIGAVSYRGYKCYVCSDALQPYTLIAYTSGSSRYQECPDCQELTVTRTGETLKKSTYTSEGQMLVKDQCHCCDRLETKIEVIPRLRRTQNNRRSASNRNGSSGYYTGSYGGGGGAGGSSGGGFGGGSSGGGGAGGSW